MPVFGPVPSRRLGNSLGINHIPKKHCTYACVYCQAGATNVMHINRRQFYNVSQIISEVEEKINACKNHNLKIDFISLVPDGEPLLDINLGKLIERLKHFEIPIAVISNSSLINHAHVRDELMHADWVSLKIDSVKVESWRHINRPHGSLSLKQILQGISEFRNMFKGIVASETMLVEGLNDSNQDINLLTDYLLDLKIENPYFSIPIRPPNELWVRPPKLARLCKIAEIIRSKLANAVFLFEKEKNEFPSIGRLKETVISIASVHPIREDGMKHLVTLSRDSWQVIEELITEKKLQKVKYLGDIYYRHSNCSLNNK